MYLRYVVPSSPLFGKTPQTVYKRVYINMAQIVRIEVKNKSLRIMESNGNHTVHYFANEKNANNMAATIISYQNVTNSDYLDIIPDENIEAVSLK